MPGQSLGLRLCAVAVLCAATVAADAAPPVQREGNLFVTENRYYRVETDVSPEAAVRIIEHLSTVGNAYYRLLKGLGDFRVPRFRVRAYTNRLDYIELVGMPYANTAGLYLPGHRLLLACVGSDNLDEILAVLRHEGWHQFTDHLFDVIPPWADEGLAEYFRFARVRGDGLDGGGVPGPQLRFVQKHLREGTALPLDELMALDLPAWNRLHMTDPLRGSLAYRQSWLLAQFLMEARGGRHRRYLNRFFVLLKEGHTVEEALEKTFRDLDALQRAWARYVLQLEPSPRFVCRENMRLLADILVRHGNGRHFTPEGLRRAILDGELGEWVVGDEDGRPVRSTDADAVASLFRCPVRGKGDIPYEFRYDTPSAPLPEIRCRHRNYTLRLWYAPDENNNRWTQHLAEEPH